MMNVCVRNFHASAKPAGMRLSKAMRDTYKHADMGHLEQKLAEHQDRRTRVIVTDGVFSMDGDIAPVAAIAELAERYGAITMVDDAHGAGVIGRGGRGRLRGLGGRVRALGADALLAPDVGPSPTLTAGSTAADVMRAYLTTHVAALQESDLGARRHLDDAVHQLRVAVRRLRTVLRVFAPMFEQDWADHLRRELGGLADVLGPVREAEVVQAHLLRLLPAKGGESARDLVRWAFQERARPAEHDLQEVLHEPRYLALLDALVDAARSPHLAPAAEGPAMVVLAPLVADAWHAFAVRAERLRLTPQGPHPEDVDRLVQRFVLPFRGDEPDLVVRLVGGSSHPVDSAPAAFRQAAYQACQEAVLAAGAVAYVLKTLDTQALIQAIRSAPEAGLPDADPLEKEMTPKEGAVRG